MCLVREGVVYLSQAWVQLGRWYPAVEWRARCGARRRAREGGRQQKQEGAEGRSRDRVENHGSTAF